MTLELNELKWSQFENKLKWNRLFPEIFTTIWETENKAHAETIFVFIFIYASKVSFHEPICCMRFAETVSLNLVSERFVPFYFFFFFFILRIFNIHLYFPTLLFVKLYLILVGLYLIIYMKLLHYIRESKVFLILLYM